MSRNRWRRYEPPSEPQTEDGDEASSTSKPDPPKSRRAATTQGGKDSKPVWIAVAVTTGVVVVPITAALIGNATDGDDALSPADTTLLDEQFVRETFEGAAETVGERVISVRLSEYSLAVEVYEPGDDLLVKYEVDNYTDGYRVVNQENHYPDYQPRPFLLEDLDPAALVSVTEEALGRTDDPYYFFVTADADEDTGEVEVVATVSGEGSDDVTVRATGSGEIVTVE